MIPWFLLRSVYPDSLAHLNHELAVLTGVAMLIQNLCTHHRATTVPEYMLPPQW